ncbi:bidirectional sugar transporter SWEET17 isoform X3 [Prunus yedoensis var. nudiflora]|uniref:Bidirectional sugar transporter SWEET17 isoform X3 n=1 Tax=Prunus yedoensis var. nudiflora TaxID=2094558 RepID=A0A314Y805_PRUYE|nr:bidirectional sugar transporter SWEET17 isoform X3 [Prunus yedoensis var. nudiflora]
MEGLILFVGVIGNIISVLMFLAPVGTFWRIVKHRSTEDFESLPYVCTFLNSFLWTYYGIIRPAGGLLVATVNGKDCHLDWNLGCRFSSSSHFSYLAGIAGRDTY